MQYVVTRHGNNAANQSLIPSMRVAIVDAASEQEACDLAERRVTVYRNQYLTAEQNSS